MLVILSVFMIFAVSFLFAIWLKTSFHSNFIWGRVVHSGALQSRSTLGDATFQVYAIETPGRANRLIIVQPMYWILWNYESEVYLVNDVETTSACDTFATPILRFLSAVHFQRMCLRINLPAFVRFYTEQRASANFLYDAARVKTIADVLRELSDRQLVSLPQPVNSETADQRRRDKRASAVPPLYIDESYIKTHLPES